MSFIRFYLFLLPVCLGSQSSIEQGLSQEVLGNIYQEMLPYKQELDQTHLYEALEIFKKQYQADQEYLEENSELMEEFYSNLLDVFEAKIKNNQYISLKIEEFLEEEINNYAQSIKKIINEKDKMIERDKREIEKIKQKYEPQKIEHEKKIKDIKSLIQDIQKVLDSGQKEDYFRLLEVIESKITIGIFKTNRDNTQTKEVSIFMLEVDKIFKDGDFKKNEVRIKNIVAIILGMAQDVRFTLQKQYQELFMEQENQLEFFLQSESTNTKAKISYEQTLNQLNDRYVKPWEQYNQRILQSVQQTKKQWDDILQMKNDAEKNDKRLLNHHNVKLMNLKHIQNDFFHTKRVV